MQACCILDFTLEEQVLGFTIENSSLAFNADLGYVQGTTSYMQLSDKPQVNGVTLIGNKTSDEIKVQGIMDEITAQDIDTIIYGG